MLPYLITFSLSFISYKCALLRVSKYLRIFCLLMCVLIPSFLAGFRDDTIGWDWRGYGSTIWDLSTHIDNFYHLLSYYPAIEPGYKLINYAVAFISRDFHVFYFFHQLLLVSIAVTIAFMNRKYRYSETILLFYLLFLFNPSMTMLRQAVAMMISFFAFAMWDRHNNKCSYVFSAIACLFHFSAFVAFLIYVISNCKRFLKKYSPVLLLVFIIVMILLFMGSISVNDFFSQTLKKMIDLNFVSAHYTGYIDQSDTVSVHKTDVLFQACLILMILCLPKKNRNKDTCSQIVFLAMSAIVLNMFGSVTDIAFRLAYYFIPPIAIYIPRVSTIDKENQRTCLIFVLLLSLRLFYFSISNGAENTVPYCSHILGIF